MNFKGLFWHFIERKCAKSHFYFCAQISNEYVILQPNWDIGWDFFFSFRRAKHVEYSFLLSCRARMTWPHWSIVSVTHDLFSMALAVCSAPSVLLLLQISAVSPCLKVAHQHTNTRTHTEVTGLFSWSCGRLCEQRRCHIQAGKRKKENTKLDF